MWFPTAFITSTVYTRVALWWGIGGSKDDQAPGRLTPKWPLRCLIALLPTAEGGRAKEELFLTQFCLLFRAFSPSKTAGLEITGEGVGRGGEKLDERGKSCFVDRTIERVLIIKTRNCTWDRSQYGFRNFPDDKCLFLKVFLPLFL